MTAREFVYSVWLHDRAIGTIHQRGDFTRFAFSEEYREDPARPVLGLLFEQDLDAECAAALRLPPWFSNLLPESELRGWIAADRRVSPEREMELLAQVGHDLPGAVRVAPADEPPGDSVWNPPADDVAPPPGDSAERSPGWRFSLAGIALKFSMLAADSRLTLPAFGEGGDWIVKLPDRRHPDVPINEFAMMSLAGAAGIRTPQVRLIHRDAITGLPANVWPDKEEWAYTVRRFDRDENRRLVHIEDLAQVRNVYADDKYRGNYETLANLVYRGRDVESLREFARRLAFNTLISNGDAHLKNWSLIYHDRRIPALSPAYDLVSTAPYRLPSDGPEELALKIGGSRRFDRLRVETFARLQRRIGADGADLPGCVAELVTRVRESWPSVAGQLDRNPALRDAIAASIETHSRTLLCTS